MATGLTGKFGLALAVGFVAMPASRAGARSITRVNRNNPDTCDDGFVLDKAAKLSESPIRLLGALRLPSLSPLANVRKFFYRNRPIRAFGFLNNPFRNQVVLVGLVAALLAAHLAKSAVSGASAYLLQNSPALAASSALALYALTCVALTVAVGRNLSNAKINAKCILNLLRRRLLNIAHCQKKVIALVENKVAFTLSRFEQLVLALATDIGNFLTPSHCPDGDELFFSTPRQDSIVKRESAKRLEPAKGLGIKLVGVRDFGNRSHRHLSRQVETFSNRSIGELMQTELLEHPVFPGNLTDSVTGRVCAFKSLAQQLRLLFRRIKFNLRYQFHSPIIARLFHYGNFLVQRKERETGVHNRASRHSAARPMPNSSPA
jgi:hypothetical protein